MREYHEKARRLDPERYRENNRRWRSSNLNDARRMEAESKKRFYATREGKVMGFIRNCLRRMVLDKNGESSCDVIGYSSKYLILHIEKTMTSGMTWENYGEWHIDHIVPISRMVKSGIYDPKIVNSLSNLRAMWAMENISKSDRMEVMI